MLGEVAAEQVEGADHGELADLLTAGAEPEVERDRAAGVAGPAHCDADRPDRDVRLAWLRQRAGHAGRTPSPTSALSTRRAPAAISRAAASLTTGPGVTPSTSNFTSLAYDTIDAAEHVARP